MILLDWFLIQIKFLEKKEKDSFLTEYEREKLFWLKEFYKELDLQINFISQYEAKEK